MILKNQSDHEDFFSISSGICSDVFLLEIFGYVPNDALFGFDCYSIIYLWSSCPGNISYSTVTQSYNCPFASILNLVIVYF